MNELESCLKEAQEIETELNKLDTKPEPHERKMRFATDDEFNPENARNKLFIQKRDTQAYGFEEIALLTGFLLL